MIDPDAEVRMQTVKSQTGESQQTAVPQQTRQRVQVTRIGTQVVVRLTGEIGNAAAASLDRAYDEVCELASSLVAVDLEDAELIEGAGLTFLARLHARWRVRLLNAPTGLRARLANAG